MFVCLLPFSIPSLHSFLLPHSCGSGKCTREVQELRTAHAETISELDKTRKLLTLQNTISRDCKREVEALQAELREVKAVYESRLEEGAQLLDIRQARIKVSHSHWGRRYPGAPSLHSFLFSLSAGNLQKLEAQLKDIAYGKRACKLDISKFEVE